LEAFRREQLRQKDAQVQFVWTELNTFTQEHSVYRLTGAPPGYAGYDDPPVFEAVLQNPDTVFMFDELDKAHPEVLKVFLSILDEGRCAARRASDGTLDFRRCVFLFTTNLDLSHSARRPVGFSSAPARPASDGELPDSDFPVLADRIFRRNEQARQAFTRQGALREIAGRFSGFVPFQPLDERARGEIAVRQIIRLGREYGLEIQSVSIEIVRDLLAQAPAEDTLSIRSLVGLIEGHFIPLFLSREGGETALRLEGDLAHKKLSPALPSGGGELLSCV